MIGDSPFQLLFSRLILMILISGMAVVMFRYRKSIFPPASDLENTKNLSIFRIVFFGFFAIGGIFYGNSLIDELETYQSLDHGLKIDVPYFNWIWYIMPEGWFWIRFFVVLMISSSFGAFLGIKTRYTIFLFIISSCYMLGYSQFFGKINHNHHIIWIAAILWLSPCDRHYRLLPKKVENYEVGQTQGYFRILWTVLGLIYFFPGLWKVWSSGFEWGLSYHLKNQLLYKWAQIPNWSVPFPIHEYPILLSCGGYFILFFELSFIFMVHFKRTRYIAAIGALIFHLSTWFFMDIFFVVMVVSLFTFIPWKRIGIENLEGTFDHLANKRFSRSFYIFMLTGIALFGIFKINSWPLSIYPTFDSTLSRKHIMFKYYTVDGNGQEQELLRSELFRLIPSEKLWQMEQDVIAGTIKESSFSAQMRKLYKSLVPDAKQLKIKRSNLELLD